MTSTRFPGKVLKEANGKTILSWVIDAVRRTPGINGVCVATPHGNVHDPVVDEAFRLDAKVYRGSESDVLSRFAEAAEMVGADAIMRITSDCPLSDPNINGQVLNLLREGDVDYACNNEPFSFPHGFDCEVFTIQALRTANEQAKLAYEREHVTPWLKRSEQIRKRYLVSSHPELAKWRLTVDYPEDYELFKKLVEDNKIKRFDYNAIIQKLTLEPDLLEINRLRRQR